MDNFIDGILDQIVKKSPSGHGKNPPQGISGRRLRLAIYGVEAPAKFLFSVLKVINLDKNTSTE